MTLSIIDFIIIGILFISTILITYFCFWKNRNKPCAGCPYAKNCTSTICKSKNEKTNKNKNV